MYNVSEAKTFTRCQGICMFLMVQIGNLYSVCEAKTFTRCQRFWGFLRNTMFLKRSVSEKPSETPKHCQFLGFRELEGVLMRVGKLILRPLQKKKFFSIFFLMEKYFSKKKVRFFLLKKMKFFKMSTKMSNFTKETLLYSKKNLMGTNHDLVEVFLLHTSLIYYGLHTNPSFGAAPPTSNAPISDLRRS